MLIINIHTIYLHTVHTASYQHRAPSMNVLCLSSQSNRPATMSWIDEQKPSANAAIFAFWDDTYTHIHTHTYINTARTKYNYHQRSHRRYRLQLVPLLGTDILHSFQLQEERVPHGLGRRQERIQYLTMTSTTVRSYSNIYQVIY